MGTTPVGKREKPLGGLGGQWKLLDIVAFTMMATLVVLFLLIFTSLGDSLAAEGQRQLDAAIQADPNSSGESLLNLTVCIAFRAHAEVIRVEEDMQLGSKGALASAKAFLRLHTKPNVYIFGDLTRHETLIKT